MPDSDRPAGECKVAVDQSQFRLALFRAGALAHIADRRRPKLSAIWVDWWGLWPDLDRFSRPSRLTLRLLGKAHSRAHGKQIRIGIESRPVPCKISRLGRRPPCGARQELRVRCYRRTVSSPE